MERSAAVEKQTAVGMKPALEAGTVLRNADGTVLSITGLRGNLFLAYPERPGRPGVFSAETCIFRPILDVPFLGRLRRKRS
jgi:hypothetical protein